MRKTQIALVDMGERLPIRLSKLARKLNSKLKKFEFSVESVTAAKVGDPTIESEWHDVEILFSMDKNITKYMAAICGNT